ncbi:MAG: molecular chaperone DnaK [Jatrophihabitans sp.]|nr:MAG: molecular chaperone DnaK [Jatrophihabitans sp.]
MTSDRLPAWQLTPAQRNDLRARLVQQRRFRLDQLAGLEAGAERNDEIAQSLTAAARAALHDVTEALQRMDEGSYGSCAACGRALPLERLELLPQVSRCAACLQSAQT